MFSNLDIFFKLSILDRIILLKHELDLDEFVELAVHIDASCKRASCPNVFLVNTVLIVIIRIIILLFSINS